MRSTRPFSASSGRGSLLPSTNARPESGSSDACAPGNRRARPARASPTTPGSGAHRRRRRRTPGSATKAPSAKEERVSSESGRRLLLGARLGAASLDEPDHPGRSLLDREVGDLDHRAAEPSVDRLGLLQLAVDLQKLGVGALIAAEPAGALLANLLQPLGIDRQADDLRLVDREERLWQIDS